MFNPDELDDLYEEAAEIDHAHPELHIHEVKTDPASDVRLHPGDYFIVGN